MAARWEARFVRGAPHAERVLRGLSSEATGALAVLAPTAKHVDLLVTAKPGAKSRFQDAIAVGRKSGASAGRIWHGTGRIRAGAPMVVVAAAAESRADALVAVQAMLNALKGVAARRDAPKA